MQTVRNTTDAYHDDLIVASSALGAVAESAQWYSYRVAKRLHATGIAVADLTARQIIEAAETERVIAADESDGAIEREISADESDAPMGIGAL